MPNASMTPPPPMSATRFSGGLGRSSGAAEHVQAARNRKVVDVVSREAGEGPLLTPAVIRP
jgi:hypothetical protein